MRPAMPPPGISPIRKPRGYAQAHTQAHSPPQSAEIVSDKSLPPDPRIVKLSYAEYKRMKIKEKLKGAFLMGAFFFLVFITWPSLSISFG